MVVRRSNSFSGFRSSVTASLAGSRRVVREGARTWRLSKAKLSNLDLRLWVSGLQSGVCTTTGAQEKILKCSLIFISLFYMPVFYI